MPLRLSRTVLLFFLLLLPLISLKAQHSIRFMIQDSLSKEHLPGVSVSCPQLHTGQSSDANGLVMFSDVPDSSLRFVFSGIGYSVHETTVSATKPGITDVRIFLVPEAAEIGEVIISSTRTNSRIDDLNIKAEVLGQEEMDEESTLVPGGIGSILGDLAIITIQRTNPVSGNDVVRMQGLDARYTQIMRDGFPLYGGFSGSLGVLSIPPLDLKQVEIIKGSVSTLYGGSAIGGLINFISRTPSDTPRTTITLNATTLREADAHFFTSKKSGRFGFTLFGGGTLHAAVDVNGDGFAEVAKQQQATLHPRFFFEPDKKTKIILGLSSGTDNRAGGDMQAIAGNADTTHVYLQEEKTMRHTADVLFSRQLRDSLDFTIKSAVSAFDRKFSETGFQMNGRQLNSFSEISLVAKIKKHTIIPGLNLLTEKFQVLPGDSVLLNNFSYSTAGIFLQDDWQVLPKFSISSGIRADRHSRYGTQILPRLSVFWKINDNFSWRLGGGTGYKVPSVFDYSTPSPVLHDIPLNADAEHSYGANSDISYKHVFAGDWSFQVDQAFYFTKVALSLDTTTTSDGSLNFVLRNGILQSVGTDTYIRLEHDGAELYLGYNHTLSEISRDSITIHTPFNPQDKLSLTLAYDNEAHWRGGVEASWSGNQFVENDRRVRNFWFVAAMVEYRFGFGSVVLNCENLLDVRQSRWEPLVTGPVNHPQFTSLYASAEGRVINLALRLKF